MQFVVIDADGKEKVSIAGDADTVDGIHAAASASADKLLALDGSSKLPASITGDADTVDAIHAAASATANKLLALDASSKLPASITGDADTVDGEHAAAFALASDLSTHEALATAGVHGSAVAATADKLVHRDGSGRAQVAAPSAAADIARKDTVDTVQGNLNTHAGLTSPHSATPDPTASRLLVRDASGRAAVAAPSAADDIARKDTVDAVQTNLDTHTAATTGIHGAVSAATANKVLIRDAAGRAKVVAPDAVSDIALKSTVTADIGTHAGDADAHHAAFVPLTSPLTSASWDGDSFSTTNPTLIDLSAVFGAPAGIQAVLLKVRVKDSGSAASWSALVLGPTNDIGVGFEFNPSGMPDDTLVPYCAVIPCNEDGDIYYKVWATGASTFDIRLQIWGYWL